MPRIWERVVSCPSALTQTITSIHVLPVLFLLLLAIFPLIWSQQLVLVEYACNSPEFCLRPVSITVLHRLPAPLVSRPRGSQYAVCPGVHSSCAVISGEESVCPCFTPGINRQNVIRDLLPSTALARRCGCPCLIFLYVKSRMLAPTINWSISHHQSINPSAVPIGPNRVQYKSVGPNWSNRLIL